jgi:hypothetical protein
LVVSHGLAATQYLLRYDGGGGGGGGGSNVVQNTAIIFVSCFLNSTYNNVIEYSMKIYGDVMSNTEFQVIFQATYFILAAPWAVFYTAKQPPPVDARAITMYFFIAFGLQLYMFNKIYILNNRESAIPANILLSGLDLVRRVIQLTYSFVWFNEPFDAVIGVSLVFLGASGGLLLYQYIRDYRYRYRYPAGALDVDQDQSMVAMTAVVVQDDEHDNKPLLK